VITPSPLARGVLGRELINRLLDGLPESAVELERPSFPAGGTSEWCHKPTCLCFRQRLTMRFAQRVADQYFSPVLSTGGKYDKGGLLDTAFMNLAEVVLLLMEPGEKCLVREAGELEDQVELRTLQPPRDWQTSGCSDYQS